jgi:hypothetical protein
MVYMKDENFEKTMDKWAAHEVESAPQMRPTEEMYRMIEARKRRGLLSIRMQRVLVGVAAACLVLAVIVVPTVLYLSDQDYEPSVGLRQVSVPEPDVIIKQPTRRGGPKKGAISFRQLMLHYQKADSQSVHGFDIRFPQEEKITLTSDDNYRLVMQTVGERHVYVYQLDSCGELMKLFPNNIYTIVQNPLQQEQRYYLPSDPNWFHLGEEKGEERIYVVASPQPIPKLDELYAQYDKTANEPGRQESLSYLLKELNGELSGEDIVVWMLVFNHY